MQNANCWGGHDGVYGKIFALQCLLAGEVKPHRRKHNRQAPLVSLRVTAAPSACHVLSL